MVNNKKSTPGGSDLNRSLAERLKQIRERAGLSQSAVANASEGELKSQSAVSAVENGKYWISMRHVVVWCSASGLDPVAVLTQWLNGEEPQSPQINPASSHLSEQSMKVAEAWERGDVSYVLSLVGNQFSDLHHRVQRLGDSGS